jgi:hypothetical protein
MISNNLIILIVVQIDTIPVPGIRSVPETPSTPDFAAVDRTEPHANWTLAVVESGHGHLTIAIASILRLSDGHDTVSFVVCMGAAGGRLWEGECEGKKNE